MLPFFFPPLSSTRKISQILFFFPPVNLEVTEASHKVDMIIWWQSWWIWWSCLQQTHISIAIIFQGWNMGKAADFFTGKQQKLSSYSSDSCLFLTLWTQNRLTCANLQWVEWCSGESCYFELYKWGNKVQATSTSQHKLVILTLRKNMSREICL